MGKKMDKKTKIISAVLFFIFFGIALGVGMYYAGYAAAPSCAIEGHKDISITLRNEITAEEISANLKNLSSVPHLAGTAQDFEQAEWMRQKFIDFGLDDAYVVPYEVLLSYPNWDVPNKIYVLNNETNEVEYSTSGRQTPLYSPEENSTLAAPNFNAYSGTGNAEGGLVYVYYGQQEDYDYLESVGIDVTDQIVLARYGASFRGNIAELAERKGAAGVILFSDPQDFAQKKNETYPNGIWMPDMAVQSGTVMLGNGDPLTIYYPAIDSAYRKPESEAVLPRIPVQPIGYKEAEDLLKFLEEDQEAPEKWQGDLAVKYYLGPGLKSNRTVKMEVHTKNQMATTYNAFGVLKGKEEPDRYVLVGNHRDAWTLGAVDPSSGTASMIEMARAFGKIKKDKNWRPRRSIIFCSWGAEEYGLVGSYEWVEQHAKVFATRAVAYLNVDIAVEGTYSLRGNGAPLMRKVMIDSAKKIPNPNNAEAEAKRPFIYDTWQHSYPDSEPRADEPYIGTLGSGSDYTSFMHVAGIPSLDIRYTYEEDIGSYPLYHTLYETHYLVSELMDKDFKYHRAITQMWADMTLTLADSVILPMDITGYATYLKEAFTDIKTRYGKKLSDNSANLDYFERAVNEFSTAMGNFSDVTLKEFDNNNAFTARRINDKLMQLERQFIEPHGLPKTIPTQQEYNHIVFAPSSSDTYSSKSFSALVDLLESVGNQTETQNPAEWSRIKEHLSVIAFMIQAAGKSLSDDLY